LVPNHFAFDFKFKEGFQSHERYFCLQVTPNLYGNLVANTAAGIAGGTGVMPGGINITNNYHQCVQTLELSFDYGVPFFLSNSILLPYGHCRYEMCEGLTTTQDC